MQLQQRPQQLPPHLQPQFPQPKHQRRVRNSICNRNSNRRIFNCNCNSNRRNSPTTSTIEPIKQQPIIYLQGC
jgi:hypothetical protein